LLDPGLLLGGALLFPFPPPPGATVKADLPAGEADGQPGTPIPVHEAVLPWPASIPNPNQDAGAVQRPSARS
jgi:hypothetical protein